MLRDLARSLSLANLCFITAWMKLLDPVYNIPSINEYLSIIANVLLLALLFWTSVTLARRIRRPFALRIARVVFALALLVPLNAVMRKLFPGRMPEIDLALTAVAIVLLGLSALLTRWDYIGVRTASAAALVLFPFLFFTMGRAVWSLTKFADKVPAAPVNSRNASATRALWLVFDEMDYQIAFAKRPATLRLPEFDRFRSNAIFATNAYPPADHTLLSVPALLTGRRVLSAKLVNPSKLVITFPDSEDGVSWDSQPNLFSKVREAGLNAAAIGWYLPYCRMIGENLTTCSWEDHQGLSVGRSSLNQIVDLISTIPMGAIVALQIGLLDNAKTQLSQERQHHLKAFLQTLDSAKKAVVDLNLNLTLVHWPVPHPPGIYDRRADSYKIDGESSYLDNFPLADRALRELRNAMEDAGVWDETAVLVTSDHWWRNDLWRSSHSWTSEDENSLPVEANHRVPFILKLQGQNKGLEYNGEFNTILTRDLLLSLLKAEVSSPENVVNWLDQHRSLEGNPYPITGSK